MALQVTPDPSQNPFAGSVITVTETGFEGRTERMIEFDVAVFPRAQVALDASVQKTWSPFDGLKINTGLSGPVTTPFTYQKYVGDGPPLSEADVKMTGVPGQTGVGGIG